MDTDRSILPSRFAIVIGRRFGAGGRKLGRELSRRLSIPYYDKELLSEAASKYGFRQEFFAHADERKPSLFQCMLNFSIQGSAPDYASSAMNCQTLYSAQSEVIRLIASEGPCVIVGRTADYVLRDLPGLLSVFITASEEERARRILAGGEAPSLREAAQIASKRDKERQEYYEYFTGRKWGHADTYHLCIDSTGIDETQTADIVQAYLGFRTSSSLK